MEKFAATGRGQEVRGQLLKQAIEIDRLLHRIKKGAKAVSD